MQPARSSILGKPRQLPLSLVANPRLAVDSAATRGLCAVSSSIEHSKPRSQCIAADDDGSNKRTIPSSALRKKKKRENEMRTESRKKEETSSAAAFLPNPLKEMK